MGKYTYLPLSVVCSIHPYSFEEQRSLLPNRCSGSGNPFEKQNIFWNMSEIFIFHLKALHICIRNASSSSKIQIQNLIQQVGTADAHSPLLLPPTISKFMNIFVKIGNISDKIADIFVPIWHHNHPPIHIFCCSSNCSQPLKNRPK